MDPWSYYAARPNEKKVMDRFEEMEPDWKAVAESLLSWLSDDDVGEWARVYEWIEEDVDD